MARQNLQGLENARRVFSKLPEENIRRITHALNKGAEEIANKARQAVPVGDYAGGGDLEKSIDVETTGIRVQRGGRSAAIFVVAGTNEGGQAYARQQEFGRAPGPDGHPGHEPQPFMFPAYWALRRRVVGRVRREIKRAAKAVAGRG